MLLNYWEKLPITANNWQPELTVMGITAAAIREVIAEVVSKEKEAIVSSYHFRAPLGEPGSMVVCHNLRRGALIFGTNIQWGDWDEAYETLTLDESGEKYDFAGKPVYEGDSGSCALGNF